MENPKRRRWWGWFFLAFAALLFFGGLGAVAWQHLDVRRYQPVPARVLSSSLTSQERETTDSEAARTTTTVYLPHISYEYQVGGRTYQSSRVFAWAMVEAASRGWAQWFVDHYRPGEPTTAYCNPANPSDAILTRRLSLSPYILVAASMLFLALGIAAMRQDGMLGGLTRKGAARLAAGLWHGTGVVVWGQFFLFEPRPWGWLPLIVATVYEWLGMIPFGLSLPNKGLAGRMRTTLVIAPIFSGVGAALGMVVGFLGMAVGWITPLFMKNPVGGEHWAGYGAAAGAVVFAVMALVAGPLGKISWSDQNQDAEEPA